MGFTVVGSDGRRIERGAAEPYAHELAARIRRETGEQVTVVEDEITDTPPAVPPDAAADLADGALIADGINRDADATAPVAAETGTRTRRRKP